MQIKLKTEQDTKKLAEEFASKAKFGDIFLLSGNLGAGKTTFAKHFIQTLTNKDINVTSPTFTICNIYETKNCPIYHFDLYRIEKENELEELGLEEAFETGITLIEWPEIAKTKLIRQNTQKILLEIKDSIHIAITQP